jgi:hypothetical protein
VLHAATTNREQRDRSCTLLASCTQSLLTSHGAWFKGISCIGVVIGDGGEIGESLDMIRNNCLKFSQLRLDSV